MKKTDYKDENGSLERFNAREHTLPEIWDALGRVTPVEVRGYDQGEDASVLVTQVCKGVAYGYPLVKGLRDRGSWYTEMDTTAVRIPEGTSRRWLLVDMPFDDMEKALFRFELNGGVINAPAETKAPDRKAVAAAEKKGRAAEKSPGKPAATDKEGAVDGALVITFGKYRDKKVSDIMKKDPGYIRWAMDNIAAFRALAERRSA